MILQWLTTRSGATRDVIQPQVSKIVVSPLHIPVLFMPSHVVFLEMSHQESTHTQEATAAKPDHFPTGQIPGACNHMGKL